MVSSDRPAGRAESKRVAAAATERKRRRGLRAAGLLVACAVLLLAGLLGAGWALARWATGTELGATDAALTRWLVAQRDPTLTTVSQIITYTSGTVTVVGLAVAAAVGSWLVWRRWREPLLIAVAVIGEATLFLSATALVERERPSVVKLDEAPPTSSFPSGHTAAGIVLYGVLALIAYERLRPGTLRKLVVAVAVVLPLAIAAARVYRGMHYVSDVIAGLLFGAAWLWATDRGVRLATAPARWRRGRAPPRSTDA